jgi:superfamily I DNA/RNA helicase
VQGFANAIKEAEGVAGLLRDLLTSGYKPRDIAIFARTESALRDRAAPALAKAGLAGHLLSDEQPPSATDVSIGTIHRAKGLEFKVVVVMGCDADAVPLAYLQKELVDEADREAFLEQERHLLYVACTRARERLAVTYSGAPSRWVEALGS